MCGYVQTSFLISEISPLDMLASAAEIQDLKVEIDRKNQTISKLKSDIREKDLLLQKLESEAKIKQN